jgi:hypothetical protein
VRLLLAGRQGGTQILAPTQMPARVLERAESFIREKAQDTLEGLRRHKTDLGQDILSVRLHPAAEEVNVLAAAGGKLVVSAATAMVGPGYHQYLCQLFQDMGAALDISWMEDNRLEDVGDPTGFFHTGDKSRLETQMLEWLSTVADEALKMRASGGQVALTLIPGHTFQAQGALLTTLGPRDDAWLEKVKDDPALGKDLFPWWDGASRARGYLGRALSLLWTSMVWRPPLFDSERQLFRRIAHWLELAYREDASLPYPWAEWLELLGYLGKGGTLAEEVARRAAQAEAPRIGYRRGDVQVALQDGWSIQVPGGLAEERLSDGSSLFRDHRRAIHFVSLEQTSPGMLEEVTGEKLEHRGARVRSQATLRLSDSESTRSTLVSWVDSGSGKALCSIQFDDPEDADWAQRVWKSVDRLNTLGMGN